MQVTIDIPEPLYREMQKEASASNQPLVEMLLERVVRPVSSGFGSEKKSQRVQLPLVHATIPGTIDLSQNLNDAFFDDFDAA